MIPYETYKVVHLLGIMLAFAAIGGAVILAATGQPTAGTPLRKLLAITHGVALFVVLLGGFGMLARLGISGAFPLWIVGKLVVWTLLAGVIVLPYRKPELGRPMLFVAPLLGLVAALLAIYHPK